MYKQITAVALFAASVSAHGKVNTPIVRPLGDAMKSACGKQVWDMQYYDNDGNIQAMAALGKQQPDYDATKCHVWQCRGYQFADANETTIHTFTPGQEVPFNVTIKAPHTGVANVSVIDLAANSVIGDVLISWEDYASSATGRKPGEEIFSVTIPTDLPSTCTAEGGCALQWWWDSRSADQTYMNCIDFVVGGGSGGSGGAQSPSNSTATTTTPNKGASNPEKDNGEKDDNDDDESHCDTPKRRNRRAVPLRV